ncbi:uncharacterized protein B0H18DRAFT_1118036 [Fomitopsis serialis]|uniref:uncharacterized protein n=1 Tax=Fomitopsis serialis TaxID=139415 RepID=UPI00200859B3|nr:uncharacterized protein B0H18DRAFT_1118036 [Neoantrodia serialis]KAH9928353.1 hypothetical protein B0H18DRAFT_1118036 [Neoantrodia serialis]
MFPLLIPLVFGAGAAFLSNVQHDVDVNVDLDGDRMVARAIEILELKKRLDTAEGALHDTLVCVRLLLLVVCMWYVVRAVMWAVWCWRGEREKGREPVVYVVLGAGVGARALEAGELADLQLVCGSLSSHFEDEDLNGCDLARYYRIAAASQELVVTLSFIFG